MSTFANRIVGLTYKRATQLTAHPANWRTHPEHQRKAVNASLREIGWIGPVIENVRTGYLIDGHERVWQAMAQDDAEVPVLQVDLNEEEEALALATYDTLTLLGGTDTDALKALLANVETADADLHALLESMAAVEPPAFTPYTTPDFDDWHVSDADVARAQNAQDTRFAASDEQPVRIVCPKCAHVFLIDKVPTP